MYPIAGGSITCRVAGCSQGGAGVDVDGDLVDDRLQGDVESEVVEHPLHRGTPLMFDKRALCTSQPCLFLRRPRHAKRQERALGCRTPTRCQGSVGVACGA